MKKEWSLVELYESIDSAAFKKDLQNLKNAICTIEKWAVQQLKEPANPVEKIETYLQYSNDFEQYTKLFEFVSLSLSTDSFNEKLIKMQDMLDELATGLTLPATLFSQFIKDIEDLDLYIQESKILQEHAFYLKKVKEDSKYLLSEKEETLLAKMQITGSGSWSKLSEQLTAGLEIPLAYNGEVKKYPLAVVRNFAYEEDPQLRKIAYEGELEAYQTIEQSMAASLNGIKGEVLTICKMRGYESPLQMTLMQSDMDETILKAMMDSIEESLPVFEKYFLKKSSLLGHDGPLPFYDLFAPVGKSNITFTYEEAAGYVVQHFTQFNPAMGAYAKNAFDSGWIDVYPKTGKRGGAFCSNLHVIGESRILTNFTGSFSDMLTLAHELGHGYHGHCLNNASYLNSDYSMPIAETASTFCETLVTKAALENATTDEKLIILENDISGMAQVIVDIYSRFLFEDEVFRLRSEGSLSPEELNDIMRKAQIKAYGGGLDKNYLHPAMWIPKPHYYYGDTNYYNFPYAYGLLFAKGLYAKYLADPPSFIRNYDHMLAATGKNDLKDIARIMDIDVTSKQFWKMSLDMVGHDIKEFVQLQ